MTTQDKLLDSVWREQINSGMNGKWIAGFIAECQRRPEGAFAEVGPILQSMLEKGVSTEDICRVIRFASYDACFGLLHSLENDPLPAEEFEGIHETILTADPSGLDGGPGSWPLPKRPSRKAAGKGGVPLLTVKRSFQLAFSPVSRLVAASDDGKIWNIDSGKEVARCKLHPNTTELKFSPDGSRVAGQNTTGNVTLFDAKTGERLFNGKTKDKGRGIAFSPDGKALLADNSSGHKVFVWRTDDGKLTATKDFGEGLLVTSVSFTKKRQCVVGLCPIGHSTEHILSTWDSSLESELSRIKTPDAMDIWLEPSEAKLAIMHVPDSVHLWNMTTRKKSVSLEVDYVSKAVFSHNQKWAGIVDRGEFLVVRIPDFTVVARRQMEYANDITFSADDKLIGLATWKQGEVWELADFVKTYPA